MTMWTRFRDMHSGGGCKERPYEHIYIEAPEKEAIVIFYNRFGHNPHRVTCTCCGEDYSISDSESLEDATGYERGCRHDGKRFVEEPARDSWAGPYVTVDEYIKRPDVLVIRAADIKPEERVGTVPEEGWIWQ